MVGADSLIVGLHFQNVGNHAVRNVGLSIFWNVGFHVLNGCAFLYTDRVHLCFGARSTGMWVGTCLRHVPKMLASRSTHGFSWVIFGWAWLAQAMDHRTKPMGKGEGLNQWAFIWPSLRA
jgi:hypothetical protein